MPACVNCSTDHVRPSLGLSTASQLALSFAPAPEVALDHLSLGARISGSASSVDHTGARVARCICPQFLGAGEAMVPTPHRRGTDGFFAHVFRRVGG